MKEWAPKIDVPISERLTDLLTKLQPLPHEEMEEYDIVIVGAGPAGLAAAITAERHRLHTITLEEALAGGHLAEVDQLGEIPGFPKEMGGPDLMKRLQTQLEELGSEIIFEAAEVITPHEKGFSIETENDIYQTKTVLLATGVTPKPLAIPGEERLRGNGVSYEPHCDGKSYAGRSVAVIGSGHRALYSALYLATFSDVFLLYEEDDLEAEEILKEQIEDEPRITVVGPCEVEEICGGQHVESVRVTKLETHTQEIIPVQAVFIASQYEPRSSLYQPFKLCTDEGFVLTDEYFMTELEGLFACGSVREKPVHHLLSDLAEGIQAVQAIYKLLNYSE